MWQMPREVVESCMAASGKFGGDQVLGRAKN